MNFSTFLNCLLHSIKLEIEYFFDLAIFTVLLIKVRYNVTIDTCWHILYCMCGAWNPLIWISSPSVWTTGTTSCWQNMGIKRPFAEWLWAGNTLTLFHTRFGSNWFLQYLFHVDAIATAFSLITALRISSCKIRPYGFKIWCSTFLAGTSTGGCPGLPLHTPQNIVKTKHKIFCFYSFCFWSNLYDVIHVFN